MKKPIFDQDRTGLTTTLAPIFVGFFLLISLFFGRMLYLQVVLGNQLKKESEANRIRHEIIPAQRGLILDREGRILAADEPVFNLEKRSDHYDLSNSQLMELARGLGVEYSSLETRLSDPSRRFVFRGLSDAQRIWFEENAEHFPGLDIRIRPKRVYHYGSIAAPVVGYTGEINPSELDERRGEGLSQGSIVGKSGVEKYYDGVLQGRNGIRWIETTAEGELIRTLDSPSPTNPNHGSSLKLTLDVDLQRAVAESFPADSEGAAVVMEIPSGRVRALYSNPSFDPNQLTIAGKERINRLLKSEKDPLHNRVIQSRFPPGSTFKLFPFLAALSVDGFNTGREFNCDGEFRLGTQTFRCWKEEGHGTLNLIQGLIHSCNVYFYNLVEELDYQRIIDVARQFQFNARTGIDLPEETRNQLSTPSLKSTRYGKPWVRGDAVNAVIGQGYTLVSPIKQAQLLGRIITKKRVTPRLVKRKNEPGNRKLSLEVTDRHRRQLLKTMDRVTDEGTGYWAQHDTTYQTIEPDILGKTGTVQKVKTDDDEDTPPSDAWFISAAPVNNPQYVVVVFRMEAGTGGNVAAPHARQIYQSMNEHGYFRKAVGADTVTAARNREANRTHFRANAQRIGMN